MPTPLPPGWTSAAPLPEGWTSVPDISPGLLDPHGGILDTLRGAGSGIKNFLQHPLDSTFGLPNLGGMPGVAFGSAGQAGLRANQQALKENIASSNQNIDTTVAGIKEHPFYAAGQILGPALLAHGVAKVGPRIVPGARMATAAIQDAAVGNRDASAIRALRVPANSPKMKGMLSSVDAARPYLQGVDSLDSLQQRIPQAKSEIWGPYKQTIDAAGNNPIKGPDGQMTTIADLENQRQQLSALNRALKGNVPEAIQEAQQKGLTAAQLLAQEKAVQSTLDPALSQFGIDPQAIRKTFGSVARIGKQVSGKDTVIEQPQPYGLGKMASVDITKPLKEIGNIGSGLRDIVAGRPLFRGSPTDIGIREGFAKAGPKPNLGRYTPDNPTALLEATPIQLGASPEVGGTPEGYRPPNYSDIFPDQLPSGTRGTPKVITVKKK